ncbi:MAG: acyl-CoA dehydrogenase [Actinobacteria bacterium]|nr:acyl-CoA dehydrogenase [Actinomycetota bacterium]
MDEPRVPAHLRRTVEKIHRLHAREVRPREEALEHRLTSSRAYLDENGRLHPELWEARREIMRAAGKAGVYSLHLPREIGGGGLGRRDMIHVEETVYAYGVGLNPAMLAWSEGATPRLIWCGPHQREEFVDPLVRGIATSLHGVTEPHAGSNFFDFTTAARKTRRGTWRLDGHKAFITNAFEADIAQVLCVTDPGKGRRSFTYFQFLTAPHRGTAFRTGRLFQTMWDDGITGEFVLDGLELSDDNIIGERGQGFDIALSSINWTRMRRGGMCAGWGRYLIDRTVERLESRIVGGKPLAANQGLQWMVADMYADWFSARATSLAVAAEIDDPGPWWKMPRPAEEIRKICLVKLVNDEAFHRVADRAVQLHGGAGMMKDNPVNKIALIARNLRVPGGSDEVQRSTIAGTLFG